MEKAKSYEITPTLNGYTVQFKHDDKYYNDQNKAVALDLKGVIEIIKKDLDSKEE